MFVVVAKSTSKQRLSVKPQSNGQTLFGKHLKFCLSSTTFVGLATKQTRPGQTFFACDIDKQSVLVKQCFSWWRNAQTCLTSKIPNVCQTNVCPFGRGFKFRTVFSVNFAQISRENHRIMDDTAKRGG